MYEQKFSQKIRSGRIRHRKPRRDDEKVDLQTVIHLDDLENVDDVEGYVENDDVRDLVCEENVEMARKTSK